MQIRILLAAAGLLLLTASPAAAQTIRAGMTEAEVRATLGPPALTRQAGEWSYLFYANGCAPRCGSDDVVFVRDGRVVTAVFRTPRRRFVGPRPSAALEGAPVEAPAGRVLGTPVRAEPPAAAQEAPGARVSGIRVVIPGTEDVSLGGAPAPEREPGRERGVIIIREGAPADTLAADTALDRARQEREGQVNPRTIPAERPGGVRPDTALDRQRQEREGQVTPRTIKPPTSPR